MSSNYQNHPELYPWVDPDYDADAEARLANDVAQAMAERDRMKANCQCHWDENGYDWNPDCPEHYSPEDSDDEAWENWFCAYRHKQERKAFNKWDRIVPLLRGLATCTHCASLKEAQVTSALLAQGQRGGRVPLPRPGTL